MREQTTCATSWASCSQGGDSGATHLTTSPGAPRRRLPRACFNQKSGKARALGLTSATGLVVGSIIGTGVFTMPAVLAGAGTSSLLVLLVIAIGAMLLATLFGQLTKRVPNSDGGLYAYARYEFGDFAGYLTGWCYWVQAWAGRGGPRCMTCPIERDPA